MTPLLKRKKSMISLFLRYFPAICILLILFDCTTTMWYSVQRMQDNAKEMLEKTENQMRLYIKSVWNLGDAIAQAPATQDKSLDLRGRAQLLIPYAQAYDLFMIGITDKDGYLGSTMRRDQVTSKKMLDERGIANLSSRPAFQEAMATGKSVLTDVYFAGADGKSKVYSIWIPYYNDGEIAGTIVISIDFRFINNIIESTSISDNYYLTLLDSRNIISANPNNALVDHTIREAYNESKIVSIPIDELEQNLNEGKTGDYWGINNGRLEYVVYAPIAGTDWKLILRTNFFGSFQNTFYALFIKLIIYLALFCIFILKRNRDLFARERMYDIMTANVNEVFFTFDIGKRKLQYVSLNAERMLGMNSDDIIKKIDIIKPYFSKLPLDSSNMPIVDEHCVDSEFRNPITGTVHPVKFRIYPAEEDGNNWVIIVLTDEEEEQKKQHMLQEALTAAEKANNAKSMFLTSMSHDIRTPMNAIVGMTAIAKANIDNKTKVLDCLDKITISNNHLLGLINDVLDMNKIESGKLTLDEVSFNILELCDNMTMIIQSQITDKQMILDVKFEDIKHPHVMGDMLRLNQIFINLAGNAIKFTDVGGSLIITIKEYESKKDGYGLFSFIFEDTGIGIDKEFIDKLFKPFERVENSTISKTEGSGLGLAITKQLVTLMKGEVSVESEYGKGSIFTVTVPLKITNPNEQKITGQDNGISASTKHKDGKTNSKPLVLLVEDNKLNMEIAVELLSMCGVDAEKAWNGKEALEKFESSPIGHYSMIITDIQMPVMDGYKEAAEIRILNRKDAKTIPIIAMTANAFSEDIQKACAAGMNNYISKPVNIDRLKDVLKNFSII